MKRFLGISQPIGIAWVAMISAGFLSTACGFSPLYGQSGAGSVVPKLAQVAIDVIADRRGQILRNKLLTALNPLGSPEKPFYRLKITLKESSVSTGIRADDTRTRGNLTIQAHIRLWRLTDHQLIYDGDSSFTGSFDLFRNPYASWVAENDARDKTLTLLSQDIKIRIALALRGQTPETVQKPEGYSG